MCKAFSSTIVCIEFISISGLYQDHCKTVTLIAMDKNGMKYCLQNLFGVSVLQCYYNGQSSFKPITTIYYLWGVGTPDGVGSLCQLTL